MVETILPIPIVVGLVEVVKRTGVTSRLLPVISLVLGVLISYLFASELEIKWIIVNGLVYGLAASGLYSGTKATLAQEPEGHVEPQDS